MPEHYSRPDGLDDMRPYDHGRLTLTDDHGHAVTINELRPKAYAGTSKRDGQFWLANVAVTYADGRRADGWTVYESGDGGYLHRWNTTGQTLRIAFAYDSHLTSTILDALHIAWLRAFRAHPAGERRRRQIEQEAEARYIQRRDESRRKTAEALYGL